MAKAKNPVASPSLFQLDPLPKDFVLAKPVQQDAYDESVIYELEAKGNLIITRKRDGWKLFAVKTNGKVKMYTDGMNEVDERLDHIKKELKRLMPDNSMVVGEGIVDINGNDDLGKISSIFQSNTVKALETQEETGMVKFMVFDFIIDNNQCLYLLDIPYHRRLARINSLLIDRNAFVLPPQILNMKYDEAKKLVLKKGWEGLVLYDRNFVSSFRLDGKNPARPKGCYKWKLIFEDDFIVREWLPSEKDPKRLKEVVLLQIDPKTKKEFYCGKVGAFTNKMREELKKSKYPIVMQVAFEGRYKSGKIRNARFMRVRSDKKVKDCVAPKSYNFKKNA